MADLTAHFVADFSNFKTAVDSATTKLKSFQTDANKVQASLGRIADSFSGRRILQEATLATKAVNDIGGATKLTTTEQARLNTQLTEAIAKYTALGQQAPADLIKLQKETATQASLLKQVTLTLGPLGTALAGAFSVTAAIGFSKALLADADSLVKLSDKTGVSLQGLQRFQAVGDDAGNSLEQITNALSKLQVNLADTSPAKEFTDTLTRMGLSINELRALDPDGQFIAISDAIRLIPDPADRARAAVVLFGRAGAEVLPTLTKGFDDLKGSVTGMSDDTIRSLDRAGDALTKYYRVAKGVGALITVEFAKILLDTSSGLQKQLEVETDVTAQLDALIKKRQSTIAEALSGKSAQQLGPLSVEFGQASEALLTSQAEALREAALQADKELEAQIKISEELRKQQAFGESWARFQALNIQQTGDLVSLLERGRAALLPTGGTGVAGGPGTPLLPGGEVNKELTAALIQAVPEVKGLAKKTSSAFSDELLDNLGALRHRVPSIITDAFTGGGGLSGALKGIGVQLANAFLEPFIDTIISGLAKGSLKRAFGNAISGAVAGTAIGGAAAGAGSVAASVGGVEASILGGGGGAGSSLAALATNPITIGIAGAIGGALLLRHFLSGGKQANDIRDQDQAQFGGPGTGSGSGFRRLADTLHRFGDDALFSRFQSANNPGDVRNSFSAIIADLSRHNLNRGIKSYADGGFVAPGVVQPAILHGGRFGERIISGNRQTQGPALNQTSVIINVSAVDAAGFDRVWKERIVPQLKLELLTNQLGTVTAINRVVAKA